MAQNFKTFFFAIQRYAPQPESYFWQCWEKTTLEPSLLRTSAAQLPYKSSNDAETWKEHFPSCTLRLIEVLYKSNDGLGKKKHFSKNSNNIP